MRKRLILGFALTLIAAGCAGTSKQPTPKEEAIENWNTTRAAVLLSVARDQYASGAFDKCRQTLGEAERMDANDGTVHIFMAKIDIEQGQFEAADTELTNARTLINKPFGDAKVDDKSLAEADYLSGVIYQRWQQPEKALDFYKNANEKAPTELSYLMAKAETLVSLGRQAEAMTVLRARIVYFEHSAVIRDAVGMLLVQEHKPAEAADMFRRAGILAPEDLSIREHLALALFQTRDYASASDILEELVKEPAYTKRTDILLTLAECQLNTGRPAAARSTAQQVCELEPGNGVAWLTLAKISFQLGDLTRAESDLRRSILIDADASQTHLLLGYLHLRQNQFQAALDNFRKASALDATDPTSLCMIGYTLKKLGRDSEAQTVYAQALKLDPKDSLATQLMADTGSR